MTLQPHRVLLVLVAGIGDFVMATPTLQAIRRGFPWAHLALLTTPQAAELARSCPHLDEIFSFDLRAYRPAGRGTGQRGWPALRELTAELRTRRFELAVNLYRVATFLGAIRMGLLFARVGAARTAGRWSGGRGILFGIRSPDRVHEVDAMLALAGTLGCRPENAIPELWIPECSRQSAMGRLREVGLAAGEPFAVLNAGSYKEEARLPLPKAVEIGRDFSRELRLPLLLTGVVSESARVEAVCQEIGPVARSIAGRTDLLELAAILERARVVVTTDSGPMHVATAMGAPLVVLFGPGDPTRFGPRGRPGQVVILQGKRRPHDPRTWHADLPAAEVVAAAHRLVADPHPPSRM